MAKEIKSLVGAFMYNIIALYKGVVVVKETLIQDVARDLDGHFQSINRPMLKAVADTIEAGASVSACEQANHDSIAFFDDISRSLKKIASRKKPVEKTPCIQELLQIVKKWELSSVSLSRDQKSRIMEQLQSEHRDTNTTGFSDHHFKRCCEYYNPPNYQDYHTYGFLGGFVLPELKGALTSEQENLVEALRDPNLEIIFRVNSSGALYCGENKKKLCEKLREKIGRTFPVEGQITKQALYGLLKDIVFFQLKVVDAEFKHRYNQKKTKRGRAGAQSDDPNVVRLSVQSEDNPGALILEFYGKAIPHIDDVGTSGMLPEETTEILETAANLAEIDMEFFINMGMKGDFKKIIEMPNIQALFLYRYYQELHRKKADVADEEDADFLKQLVWDLFTQCRNRYKIVLHPEARVKAPTYIGNNAFIYRHAVVERDCVVCDNVVILPCRTHFEDQYQIVVGGHSMLGPGARLCGDLILESNTLVDADAVICGDAPCATHKQVHAEMKRFIREASAI